MPLIDYSLAVPYHEIVRALAIIESGERPFQIGDGGQAFGLLQIHPARFNETYNSDIYYAAAVDDTWVSAEIKACAAFLHVWEPQPLDLRIQAWRLGTHAVFDLGKRDPQYLERFSIAYQKVRSGVK
jgi:hypothetical protein